MQEREPARFFEKEAAEVVVSLQIQMVALQFLVSNEPALGPEFIDRDVLERLIVKSCRRVPSRFSFHLSQVDVNALATAVVPQLARLYTKGESTDRFILILEGRVNVTIGQVFSSKKFHALAELHDFRGGALVSLRERDPQEAPRERVQSRSDRVGRWFVLLESRDRVRCE